MLEKSASELDAALAWCSEAGADVGGIPMLCLRNKVDLVHDTPETSEAGWTPGERRGITLTHDTSCLRGLGVYKALKNLVWSIANGGAMPPGWEEGKTPAEGGSVVVAGGDDDDDTKIAHSADSIESKAGGSGAGLAAGVDIRAQVDAAGGDLGLVLAYLQNSGGGRVAVLDSLRCLHFYAKTNEAIRFVELEGSMDAVGSAIIDHLSDDEISSEGVGFLEGISGTSVGSSAIASSRCAEALKVVVESDLAVSDRASWIIEDMA